jgi:hypothetical protein
MVESATHPTLARVWLEVTRGEKIPEPVKQALLERLNALAHKEE